MITLFIFGSLFLAGAFFLSVLQCALQQLHKPEEREKAFGLRFFYRPLHLLCFPENDNRGLYFMILWAHTVAQFCYATTCILFLWQGPFSLVTTLLLATLFVVVSFFVGEYFPRIIGTRHPLSSIRYFSFFASIFLVGTFPIAYLMIKLTSFFSDTLHQETLESPSTQAKRELIDLIKEANVSPSLDPIDNKLIESVIRFRDRIVREVMIPRVDVFSLAAETTINEAVVKLAQEGYSRVPIYRDTVDNIIGVLMYKDILEKYQEYEEKENDRSIIEAPISSIQKPPLYTPETKKISALLQEFRKKHTHIAIVVDEYGGTEGLVTIEDILEEIVGEIADEYDEEEDLFKKKPDGTWVVDARMTIIDAEQRMGIKIPQESDYDSIGGYVFHCAGTIPKQGFRIHRDEFEIEVLSSNERCVEQVKIKSLEP